MKEQKKKKKRQNKHPNKRMVGGRIKGFVLYFKCKIANPRIMFTFMFSVVQSLDHFIQTSAFSSLAASCSLQEGTGAAQCRPVAGFAKERISWAGISVATGWESLLSIFLHDCLTLFLWSKGGNGFISKLCLTCCPLVVSIMSHPSLLDAALGWVHEMQVRALFQKREANSWVMIQITTKACSHKSTLGLYIL